MTEQLPDRFYARVWLHWASFLILGFLGVNSTVMGVLFWTGSMKDANNKFRPEAGPPAVIIGSLILLAAINAFFSLWQRFKPQIHCFREGVECRVSTVNAIDMAWYLPRIVRALWWAISLPAMRYQRVWLPWGDFISAQVNGQPMKYSVLIYGAWQSKANNFFSDYVEVQQVDLKLEPHQVADILKCYARDSDLRQSVLSTKDS